MIYVLLFYPTALATTYSRRLKFVRAKQLAMDEGRNCAYVLRSNTANIGKKPHIFWMKVDKSSHSVMIGEAQLPGDVRVGLSRQPDDCLMTA